MSAKRTDPSININNKWLVLLLSAWAAWTQIKDAVAGWTLRDSRLSAVEKDSALNHSSVELLKERCAKIETAAIQAGNDRTWDTARIAALETKK